MLSFVIKRRDYKEFDQIIVLYTAERGKIEVLARGIKKGLAKNAAALEGPALVEVETSSGKEFPVMTTATIVEPFYNLRATYVGLMATSTILNILNELTPKGVSDEKVFTCIYKIFAWLNKSNKVEAVQVDMAILAILRATGFSPEVSRCVVCGEVLNVKSSKLFSVQKGGVVCVKHSAVEGVKISENTHSLFMAKTSQKKAIKIDVAEAKIFHKIVYDFLVFHTGKEVGDWSTKA